MSNISTIEVKPVRASLAPRSRVSAPKPQVTVRARLVSYPQKSQRARARRIEAAVAQVLVFVFVTFLTYGVSSIAGQVMVEQSRREETSVKRTTLSALRAEAALHSHILSITNQKTIIDWASTHEFTSGVAAIKPTATSDSLLAMKD